MKKFLINLIMFLVLLAYNIVFIFFVIKEIMAGNYAISNALIFGIFVSIIYAILCFFVKPLRNSWTIWWGFLALADAAWWIYLFLSYRQ